MTLRLVAVCLLLAATGLSAQSQPPPPTPTEGRGAQQEQPQPQSSDPNSLSVPNNTGVTVNVYGGNYGRDPDQRAETANQNAPSDWREWLPNWIIAAFTLVTLFVAYRQWQITGRQATIAETQNTIVGTQNKILESQTTLMKEELQATKAATEATRQSIIMTHRPQVILRNVDVTDIDRGNRTGGQIWATNIGFSQAKVIKFDAQWYVGDDLPMKNPYARAAPTTTNVKTILSGKSQHFDLPDIPDDEGIQCHRAIHAEPERPAPKLFLIGVLKYRDELGNLRRTSFCRYYDRTSKRFVKVDDEDYEHAD